MDLLAMSWAGNSVLRWAIAAAILLALPLLVAIVGRLLRLGRLAAIGEVIRAPTAALLRLMGVWVILREVLVLPDWLGPWLERVLYFAFAAGVGWLLARLVGRSVEGYLGRAGERDGAQVDKLLHPLFRGVSSFLVWAVVLVLALDNAGVQISALLAGLGIGGIAVAMAAKDLLSDILGGIYIMLNRPFKVGDKIMYKDQWATVVEFGLRTTRLIDFKYNFKYVVPNGYFTTNAVVNISDHPGHMILMNIRLSLTNEADKIEQALTFVVDILKKHPEVRYIWSKLDHFDDYSFTLRIHYDILEFRHRIRVKSEVNLAIARAFQSHGIKFAAMPVRALQDDADAGTFVG